MSDVAPKMKTTFELRMSQLVRQMGSTNDNVRHTAFKMLTAMLQDYDHNFNWLGNIIEEAPKLQRENAELKAALNGKKYTDEDFSALYAQAKEEGRQEMETNYRDAGGTVSLHAMALFCLNKVDQLNDWEKQFIQDMAAKTSVPSGFAGSMLSPKQEAHLKRVYFKQGGRP
jgi:hypothetical protein